jgi:glutamyl-tRNA synthetase
MRERVTFVREFYEKSPYFFQKPEHFDSDVVKKRWKPETPGQLKVLVEELSHLQNPTKEDYESALHRAAETFKIKNSELIHPLRLAVSGVGAGPGLYDILIILGKEETIQRIVHAIEKIK